MLENIPKPTFESKPEGNGLEVDFSVEEMPELPDTLPSPDDSWLPEKIRQRLALVGLAVMVAASPMEKAAAQETELSPEKLRIVESVIGQDLMKELEGKGYSFSVPVEADENGSYILHIGQLHSSAYKKEGTHIDPRVLGSQEEIYDMVPMLTSKVGSNVVFTEGVVSDLTSVREKVISMNQALSKLSEFNQIGKNEIQATLEVVKWYINYSRNSLAQNSTSAEEFSSVASKLETYLRSLPLNLEQKQDVDAFVEDMRSVSFEHEEDAVIKLYMEGVVEIAPAETIEANQVGHRAAKKMRDTFFKYQEAVVEGVSIERPELKETMNRFKELYFKRDQHTITDIENTELDELLRKYGDVLEAFEEANDDMPEAISYKEARIAFEEDGLAARNRAAVELIGAYNQNVSVTFHPILVYGSNHEFGPELTEFNASNDDGDIDRGLIEIKKVPGDTEK